MSYKKHLKDKLEELYELHQSVMKNKQGWEYINYAKVEEEIDEIEDRLKRIYNKENFTNWYAKI